MQGLNGNHQQVADRREFSVFGVLLSPGKFLFGETWSGDGSISLRGRLSIIE
jgi:hypothetical protein